MKTKTLPGEAHSTYRGITIYRNGYQAECRWYARGSSGRLMADTLARMRELIRQQAK